MLCTEAYLSHLQSRASQCTGDPVGKQPHLLSLDPHGFYRGNRKESEADRVDGESCNLHGISHSVPIY